MKIKDQENSKNKKNTHNRQLKKKRNNIKTIYIVLIDATKSSVRFTDLQWKKF